MTTLRYEVTLSSRALDDPTAFAPIPAATTSRWSAAQAQGWTIHGQPGTEAIPAPRSAVGAFSRPGSPAFQGTTASEYMPARWYPNLYYARQVLWGAIGGVRIYSDNQIPIPAALAADPRWVTPVTKKRQPWLGERQVSMGPVLPVWKRFRGR